MRTCDVPESTDKFLNPSYVFEFSHFKLNNKLREAEPKIKHIADYEKEVDKLYHNQLLW
jgi:hypothetical protein